MPKEKCQKRCDRAASHEAQYLRQETGQLFDPVAHNDCCTRAIRQNSDTCHDRHSEPSHQPVGGRSLEWPRPIQVGFNSLFPPYFATTGPCVSAVGGGGASPIRFE